MKKIAAAIFMICFIGPIWAKPPSSSPTPTPTPMPETGPDVDILHGLRRSTISIGLRIYIQGKTRFVPVGSGVIVAWDEHHACILTAKHIFYNPAKSFFPTVLYVRLPQSEPRSEDDLGVELPLMVNGKRLWNGSDDADLAVIGVPEGVSVYKDLHAIFMTEIGGEDDVFQGAPVVVMGYPELLGPDYQTTPIARNGIVAWTNPNGRLDHTFLVDANVFNGNSGGPVFHLPTGISRKGPFSIGGTPKLIGIISQDAGEEALVHVGASPVTATDQQTGIVTPLTAKVLNIGGIGIAEPISKAKKLIMDTFNLNPPASPQSPKHDP